MALAPPPNVLTKTPVYRMVHVDCLETLLLRDAIHAPSMVPEDGLPYLSIHAESTQVDRSRTAVPCGPGGAIGDYVGFYFGPRSPMLYRLHTGYDVGKVSQENILYLIATAQELERSGLSYVFTDRHSLARFAAFRDRLADLDIIDWKFVYASQWNSTADLPDRQEKKQAEFLVHGAVPWRLISEIGVRSPTAGARVETILARHPKRHRPAVSVRAHWYY